MSPKDWKREIETRAAEHAPRVPAWKDEIRRTSGMSEEGLRRLVRGMADFERTDGPEIAVPQFQPRRWHQPCECAELRERLCAVTAALHVERVKKLAWAISTVTVAVVMGSIIGVMARALAGGAR